MLIVRQMERFWQFCTTYKVITMYSRLLSSTQTCVNKGDGWTKGIINAERNEFERNEVHLLCEIVKIQCDCWFRFERMNENCVISSFKTKENNSESYRDSTSTNTLQSYPCFILFNFIVHRLVILFVDSLSLILYRSISYSVH